MPRQSKRFSAMLEQTRDLLPMSVSDAVKKLFSLEGSLPEGVKPCQFDQTVEGSMHLGVDPKQADQLVRGSIVLPHGTGRVSRVLVFAEGELAEAATEAGADYVGAADLAEKVKGGWFEFDVAIATPKLMSLVGPLGRVLGPRKLMPSPRAGTVTDDVAAAIAEYKPGTVEVRVDAGGNLHVPVGKMSFSQQNVVENIDAFITSVRNKRPMAAKGTYIHSATISATMAPAVPIIA